jgi:hypothetical protein
VTALAIVSVVFLLAVVVIGWRAGRQGSAPDDLRRADDAQPTKPSMLGRYWPGPW